MEKDMSKKQLVLFFVTLCLTNIAMMVDSAIIPAVDGMFSSFPDQVNLVNYIISGAALLSVIGSILGGKLIQYFSKKSLMLVSLGVFGASSIFGAAVLNATYMAVMRSFVGISWGVINVTAMAMIAEVFITEEHRSKMMGDFQLCNVSGRRFAQLRCWIPGGEFLAIGIQGFLDQHPHPAHVGIIPP